MPRKPSLGDLKQRRTQNMAAATAAVAAAHERTEAVRALTREQYLFLQIAELSPDPEQPRKIFDPERLAELKDAILALGGLRNPIHVRRAEGHGWVIVHGERRWKALTELVEAGHDEFREVPVLISRTSDADVRWLRIEQVLENEARESLLPLEVAEQYQLFSVEGREAPLTPSEVAAETRTELRKVQRYLQVGRGLTSSERALLMELYPDAPLKPLCALVSWLEGREGEGRGLDVETRELAIRRFAEKKPSEAMVRVELRDLVGRKGVGRPPRKRFVAGVTPTGAFQVKLTLPPSLARDPTAIGKALEDLDRARFQLEALRAEAGERSGNPTQGN